MPSRPARLAPVPDQPKKKRRPGCLGGALALLLLAGGCMAVGVTGDDSPTREVEPAPVRTSEPTARETIMLDPVPANPAPADPDPVAPVPAAPAPVVTPAAPLTDTPAGLDPALPDAYLDAPAASQSFVYGNCSEAAAAGSGAVYRDTPNSGYGPHLDDDLDGVGCESLG